MREETMKIKIDKNAPITMVGEILFEGAAEQGDGKPCRKLTMRGRILEGSRSQEVQTISFYTPTCKWMLSSLWDMGYEFQ